MVKFTFDIPIPGSQYAQITAEIPVKEELTFVQLSSWRPGRYELGNFAKNVRNFKIFDQDNRPLEARKVSKDRWAVPTASTEYITVKYGYFATDLNAGSTYVSPDQLYVNPVNCCVYTDETFNDSVELKLNVPSHWQVATSLEKKGDIWTAESTEELFDSPFIASGQLQHQTYVSGETTFYVWFNGEVKPDWDKVIRDFKGFTDAQISKFIEFPVKEYHFLNQIVPYRAYHGVEHLKSTVILLGPTYDVFGDVYHDLLGVSSHELYHAWNVKSIRPIEMFPYNYTKENYSRLGYLCEGVTTYMGDLFLLKGGVFSEDQYFNELNRQLQKHFDNPGRFNYSVADSSFDTWLDGYVSGAPGRKVSIYTEGCLLAFATDVKIRQATNSKYGLDEVMKRLYFDFALQGKGVSEEDYQAVVEAVAGISFDKFFKQYVFGTSPYESLITECLDLLGMELIHEPSKKYAEAKLGFKYSKSGDQFVIQSMYPGGPAETAGFMLEDTIIAINGMSCNGELDKWLTYFDDDTKTLTIDRKGQLLELTFPEVNRNFYMTYSVRKLDDPNNAQKLLFKYWIQ